MSKSPGPWVPKNTWVTAQINFQNAFAIFELCRTGSEELNVGKLVVLLIRAWVALCRVISTMPMSSSHVRSLGWRVRSINLVFYPFRELVASRSKLSRYFPTRHCVQIWGLSWSLHYFLRKVHESSSKLKCQVGALTRRSVKLKKHCRASCAWQMFQPCYVTGVHSSIMSWAYYGISPRVTRCALLPIHIRGPPCLLLLRRNKNSSWSCHNHKVEPCKLAPWVTCGCSGLDIFQLRLV